MQNFLFAFLFSLQIFGQSQLTEKLSNKTFSAKVIGIMDGDTMEILFKNVPLKIRLAHIDCPEKRGKQPFGNQAKLTLSDLCFGRIVTIKGEKYDRYSRLIAIVINDKNQNVNQEMVKLGMAWHYTKYSNDTIYAKLETEARKNRVGLWKENDPVAPWLWREKKKK
ncbi:thermonuclease family protein [Epilithonimonas sp. UC225_85]|uniref:thermonuclease family protein n=1 Tax=Epilithonimonas sp. UC225_85 TaxID=3350167 RepID=UPI0036D3E01F